MRQHLLGEIDRDLLSGPAVQQAGAGTRARTELDPSPVERRRPAVDRVEHRGCLVGVDVAFARFPDAESVLQSLAGIAPGTAAPPLDITLLEAARSARC